MHFWPWKLYHSVDINLVSDCVCAGAAPTPVWRQLFCHTRSTGRPHLSFCALPCGFVAVVGSLDSCHRIHSQRGSLYREPSWHAPCTMPQMDTAPHTRDTDMAVGSFPEHPCAGVGLKIYKKNMWAWAGLGELLGKGVGVWLTTLQECYMKMWERKTVAKPDRLGKFSASQQKRAFSSGVCWLAGNTVLWLAVHSAPVIAACIPRGHSACDQLGRDGTWGTHVLTFGLGQIWQARQKLWECSQDCLLYMMTYTQFIKLNGSAFTDYERWALSQDETSGCFMSIYRQAYVLLDSAVTRLIQCDYLRNKTVLLENLGMFWDWSWKYVCSNWDIRVLLCRLGACIVD